MLKVESYSLAPGQCHLCGGQNLPAVDTLRDVDTGGFEGRLYICSACSRELGTLMGMLEEQKLKATKAENRRLKAKLEERDSFVASVYDRVVEAVTYTDVTEED